MDEPSKMEEPPKGQAANNKDEAQNLEISGIWLDMQDRVAKLAKLAGAEVDTRLGIEGVLKNLDRAQNPTAKHPKLSKFRKIFDKSLQVIDTVGGIVADGASQVFGPAGQCYNAISFVIGAYQGYQSAFADLGALLHECSTFLIRLKKYSEVKIDSDLIMVVYQHLDLITKICTRAYHLRGKSRSKIKTFFSSAFLRENGMEELLSEMKQLVDDEGRLVGAETFKYAQLTYDNTEIIKEKNEEMDGKLDILVESSSAIKRKGEKEDEYGALLHVLSYDKTSSAWNQSTQKPNDSWENSYNNLRKDHVDKTGEWLFENQEFRDWVNLKSKTPLIGLIGRESSGKSFLASSVIKYLRSNPITEQPDARQLVAFYWMDKEYSGIGDISKALVWQFVEDDDSYLQTVAAKCKDSHPLDPKDILPSLLLDSSVRENVDATFYIVINKLGGTSKTLDPSLLNLLQRVNRSQSNNIRILFTATFDIEQDLRDKRLLCPTVSINQHNFDDIRKFIVSRMDSMESLSDKSHPKVRDIREEIIAGLSTKPKGDYTKIDLALTSIGNLDDVEAIRKVVAKAGDSLMQNITSEIDALARNRSAPELAEINDIILWVEYGQRSLSVKEMSKLLEWMHNKVSIRSLSSKFKTKYTLFEVDSDGMVAYKSSKFRQAILFRDDVMSTEQQNDKNITRSEVKVLDHFLKQMCPPDLLGKLDLKSYLDQKVDNQKPHIFKEDPATANATLATYCLQLLTQNLQPQFLELRGYASASLLMHLDLTDLAEVSREIKSQVGPHLVNILFDKVYINNVFFVHSAEARLGDWIFSRTFRRAVEKWLKDSAAMSKVDPEPKAWAEKAIGNPEDPYGELLKPTAHQMAHHCFGHPNWSDNTLRAFLFIVKYIFKSKFPKEPYDSPSFEQIQEAEEWSVKSLRGNVEEVTRELQMGWLLQELSFSQQAEKRCRRVLELDPSNYSASYLLAKIVPSDQEAISILNRIIGSLKADPAWVKDNTPFLVEMKYELANRYWNVDLIDQAKALYLEVFQDSPKDTKKIIPVLPRYRSHQLWDDALQIMKTISLVHEDPATQRQVAMVLMHHEELHKTLVEAMLESDQLEKLNEFYRDLIAHATEVKANEVSCYARYYGAMALTKSSTQNRSHALKMVEAALRNESINSELGQHNYFLLSGADLAALYLSQVLDAKATNDPHRLDKYLGKLSTLSPDGLPEWQLMLPPQVYEARYSILINDEKRARQLTHDTLKVALELLSDDDLTNDADAFERLFFVFLALGDKKNATTALAMISLCQRTNAIAQGTAGRKAQNFENWGFSLGIREKTVWAKPGGVSWCKNCMNIIDETNAEKTFKSRLRFNICQGKHDPLVIDEWDPERLKKLPTGHVPWGDQDIHMKEWEKHIRVYMDTR